MDDDKIIQLYIKRDEKALLETDRRYHAYLMKLAMNILGNEEDCEECLDDAYLAIWNNIDINRQYNLKIYLARIVKNNALNLVKKKNAEKRGGGQYVAALDELEDVLHEDTNPEKEFIQGDTLRKIESFLDELSPIDRKIFVRRYWYVDSPQDIAKYYGLSHANVRIKLHRTLKKLKKYLEENDL